ncbi:MAG: HepT-like ribonuclease domain-containing protein [Thiolinea sp.]
MNISKKSLRTPDRLAHGYFTVDARTVWQTVQEDLSELKGQVDGLLKVD